LVQQVNSANQLTVGKLEAILAANEAASLTFVSKNVQRIPASEGQLLVTCAVDPDGDLVLTAESGTPEVTVFVLGA
jgi:hypothetical protein